MTPWFVQSWLRWLLFWLTLGQGAFLLALVFLSPFVDNASVAPQGWGRVLALFARDITVRRTVSASAIGLLVTACIFYRPPLRRHWRPRKPRRPRLPPQNAAGA
jgi:hypothetical protein